MNTEKLSTTAWLSTVFISFTTWSAGAIAQANYVSSELATDTFEEVYYADMDGDSRDDIVLPKWSQQAGRELYIYLQNANGRFSPEPSRRVEIKPEIIAFAFADTREEPGKELLLFTSNRVFSLSSAIPSYSGNLAPLFDWPFVASAPERRTVRHFAGVSDLNNDGIDDIMLPGRNGYGYFVGTQNGQFSLSGEFSTINPDLDPSEVPLGNGRVRTNLSINEREGLVFQVEMLNRTAFENFLTPWEETKNSQALLDTEYWQPAVILGNLNDDNRTDIVYMNIGTDLYGQINVLLQDESGQYPGAPNWQGPIDVKGDIRLLDFNGDGRKDIIRMVNNSNEWDVYFYANKNGKFAFEKADQVMRFSGYDLTISSTNVTQGGSAFLTVNYYTIPVVNAIRNASIVRSHLMYAPSKTGGQLFNSRPDFRLDETFSATEVRGLSSLMRIDSDLNGDAANDAVYITSSGALAAKAISPALQLASEPFWQHVPNRSILRFEIRELNGDNKPDFVLFHSNAISLLVSTP